MADYQIKLTGWNAVIAAAVIIVVVGVRLMTMSDLTNDSNLSEKLEFELMTNYFPKDVEKLKTVYEAGDLDSTNKVFNSIASSKVNLISVRGSSPLFELSTNKRVIVKVTYSVTDESGTRDQGTKYYQFKHGTIGNTWHYERKSYAYRYYMNFF